MTRTRALLFLALLLAAVPAAAESPRERLVRLEQEIAEARAARLALGQERARLAVEEAALRARLVEAASAVQAQEAAVLAIEERLRELAEGEAVKASILAARHADLAAALAALQRLSLEPPGELLLRPQPPVDIMRSALLLGAVVPALRQEATALVSEMAALGRLRGEMEQRRSDRAAALDRLAQERAQLARLVEGKQAEGASSAAALAEGDARLARLARQADDVQTLLRGAERQRAARAAQAAAEIQAQAEADSRRESEAARLAARLGSPAPAPAAQPTAVPAGPAAPPFDTARGRLVRPVQGTLIARFGDAAPETLASKGLRYRTRPRAQVVVPWDGEVVFAGPFRGYGQLLIVSHGDGYHSLLAGMDQIDGAVGQHVVAGEPVGTMGADSDTAPTLYVELRQGGEAIDPLPWLSRSQGKVSG
ncbi:murein hydrolase activator EnvC family protein [Zavarzinia sp. CC-PAN008]|uniref:murein hydrolase activator EnvC family protein n=1 Tax=Zavarzinia sp. CC-PAN008 TaxID=3243332 RepID=UPI003F7476D5